MFSHICVIWFLGSSSTFIITVNGDRTCEEKLEEAKLVPEYVDNETVGDLKVVYEGKFPLQCGNEMSIAKTAHAPTVTYDLKGKCKNAAIIFFDPDIPFPLPKVFLHWFVMNIPAKALKKGYSKEEGRNIYATYFPSLAPTGNHRYTFCVYCQEKYIRNAKHRNGLFERIGVHPKDIAETYHLGNPLACNFHYLVFAEVDVKGIPLVDKVLDINKKLGNRDATL